MRDGLDPNILAEAQAILQLYSRPAQEAIKQNLYGAREARLAGAIVKQSFTVEVCPEPPPESEQMQELRGQAATQVATLCQLLRKAVTLLEERVSGAETFVAECESEINCAEENFFIDEDGSHADQLKRGPVFIVVFPALDLAGKTVVTTAIDEFVKRMKGYGITTWVADESDYTKRLKAMTMREIYNIGRVAAVVLTNKDGIVLDGWYNGMPWVDEVIGKVKELT